MIAIFAIAYFGHKRENHVKQKETLFLQERADGTRYKVDMMESINEFKNDTLDSTLYIPEFLQ
jgi:hypothetical protein